MPSSSEGLATFEEAEAARKGGDFARAGRTFHALWNAEGRAAVGWRYAFCLRKAGYADAALRVVAVVRSQHVDDVHVRNEHVWCLYAARLQPAQKAEDEAAIFRAADEMIEAGADALALRLAVLAAAGAAKRKGHWRQVSAWCDRLDPSQLESEGRQGERGRLPSERERWYFAKVKALLEMGEFQQAETQAGKALASFGRNVDFRRWRARALSEMGRHEEAVAEITSLLGGRGSRWYAYADACLVLSRVEGRADDAWRAGLEGLRQPAEDTAQVSLQLLVARLAADRGDQEAAVNLLGWCMAIRTEQKWALGEVHHTLRQRLEASAAEGPIEWNQASAVWKTRCRTLLRDAAVVSAAAHPPTAASGSASASDSASPSAEVRSGKLQGYEEGRPFAFIHAGRDRIFVLARDIPEALRITGTRVRFRTVTSFDKKKNCESLRAVDVGPCHDGRQAAPEAQGCQAVLPEQAAPDGTPESV